MGWLDCEAIGRHLKAEGVMGVRTELEGALLAQHCMVKGVSLLEFNETHVLRNGVILARDAEESPLPGQMELPEPEESVSQSSAVSEDSGDVLDVLDNPGDGVRTNAAGEVLSTEAERQELCRLAGICGMKADDVATAACKKFQVSDDGIVIIPKDYQFETEEPATSFVRVLREML